MPEPVFNVILEGTVKPDRQRSEVLANLCGIFKKDRETVEKLLSGKPRLIRRGIDLQAAQKYHRIIEKAGAACRIEPVSAPEPLIANPPEDEAPPNGAALGTGPCPRCGYVPATEDDVMIVRGDCPRCGLMVKGSIKSEAASTKLEVEGSGAAQTTDAGFGFDSEAVSASLPRRVLASIYTFGYFMIAYCLLVLLFILCFIPLVSVPRYVARDFLIAAYTVAPSLMTAMSILTVSFFVPLFNEGRSWGQQAFAIELLYTAEAQSGGLLMSLAFRVGAMLLLTLAPGLVVVWTIPEGILPAGSSVEPLIMAVMALVGWSFSWLVCLMSSSRRSVLDRAGGTVQTEIGVMPTHPVRRGLAPLLLVFAVLGILGLISHALAILGR